MSGNLKTPEGVKELLITTDYDFNYQMKLMKKSKYSCPKCESVLASVPHLEGTECGVCGTLIKMSYKDLEKHAKKLAKRCRKLSTALRQFEDRAAKQYDSICKKVTELLR